MLLTSVSPQVADYWSRRRSVPGAFHDVDFLMFDRVLTWQHDAGVDGDLLEIGALYGKSAIVLGRHARASDEVFICDVFEGRTHDAANDEENNVSYSALSRGEFLRNYGRFVDRPPTVIQALSETIPEHVLAGSLRFAHIDGGHMFETVRNDISSARTLLSEEGAVVIDDFRALHTPGVAAATWMAVADGALIPVCITEQKFYGTFHSSGAASLGDALETWISSLRGTVNSGKQMVAGRPVLVVQNPFIPSTRARLKGLVPPALVQAFRPRKPPYLGN